LRPSNGEFGGVDILVNITGGPPPTPASGQHPSLWSNIFQAIVLSVIAAMDRALPGMRARRWGRIVTSTSSGVVAPIPNRHFQRLSPFVGRSVEDFGPRNRGRRSHRQHHRARGSQRTIRLLDEQKAEREGRAVEAVVAESTASIPAGRYGEPRE
jgi:3-oxoacyl-[acyl-carrier protein] reductase